MTFSITPGVLLGLLNKVCEGIPKRQRAGFHVTLSAGRKRVSIIGNGMAAAVALPVRGQGQCLLRWQKTTDVLATFPASTPVRIECNRHKLKIESFFMAVENYKPEAVPQDHAIPSGPSQEPSLRPDPRKRGGAGRDSVAAGAPDGYSLPPPERDDCTGAPGMVAPEDYAGPREPVVCPVCQSVGYFKKSTWSDGTFYSRRRSWASAQAALTVVVLCGSEKPRLCPRCLHQRLHGSRYIGPLADQQTDMFDEENQSQV